MSDQSIRPEIAAIVAQIDELRPLLLQYGAKGEEIRRIPDETFEPLLATGAFSISAPARFGGYAANTREANAVARAIARGDGGTAWVNGIFDSSAWVVGQMDDRAQQDVWGTERGLKDLITVVLALSSDAKKVDGGYLVSGQWNYGTGCLHSTWSLVGIPFKDENGNQVDAGLALIPNSELTLVDNWFVAGMKTTGSVGEVAKEVFVPEYRTIRYSEATEGRHAGTNPDLGYTTAFIPTLFMKLVGSHLGMGRQALDYVLSKASSKAVAYTGYERQSDVVSFQLAMAKASADMDAADALAERIADEIWDYAKRGIYPPYAQRVQWRAQAAWVVQKITDMIHDAVTAHGSAGFADSASLQRVWRDQAVAARHGHTLASSCYDAYGKLLMGHEDQTRALHPVM